MGLPSKQRTRTSKRQRASHFALKKTTVNKCEKCGGNILPHQACKSCGTYKGRNIIDKVKRVIRKTRKNKTK
jgi:large subunit ribosomal protein L32